MTPAATWHPAEEVLQDYVDGGLPGLSAGSVESHLLSCATCRHLVREGVHPTRLTRVLEEVEDRLDAAERPWLERLLVRCGLGESDARALLAAPNLRAAWVLAVVGAAALGLLAAANRDPDAGFLILAPLLPLVCTAMAYAPALDPAYALTSATPYGSIRLLLSRSLAVGATSLVGVSLATLALPAEDLTAVVWLLPALALTLLVLVLSPRLGTGAAAGAVGGSWVALVGSLERGGVDVRWVQDGAAQALCAAVALGAVLFLMTRWTRWDEGGRL